MVTIIRRWKIKLALKVIEYRLAHVNNNLAERVAHRRHAILQSKLRTMEAQ